jgi:thioredoxin reductase (NADPH)
MSKPVILTVDDDPQVVAAIARDLRERYGENYLIIAAQSGAAALKVLGELVLRDQPVALIAADQRMPQMTGIELLAQARAHAGSAKYLLLTAYADTDVAIRAINDIGLDYYLLKPWAHPKSGCIR